MKIKHGVSILGIPILFSVLVPVYGQNAYILTKLTPPGTYFSEAYAINDHGHVTLRACDTADSPQAAFIYDDGYLTGIGDLPGGMGNFPFAINNLGQVAGYESLPSDGSHEHAYLFSEGLLSDLGTLPGGVRTLAYAINDAAQIAGYVDFSDGTRHAFLYANGVMADLGTLGGTESAAAGINDAGDVVGYSFTASHDIIHAFVYRGGVMTDLFSLTAGRAIEATAINNHGVVVGRSRSNHAFIFRDGILEELGTLGGSFSSAYAVNDNGQVVGYASAADNSAHAFLYGPETGVIDLNSTVTLSDGIVPGFLNLNSAKGINELGQIVGTGTYFDGSAQSTQAFLLTPAVPQTAAPEFSPAGGGPYTSVIWVTITSATSGATIRYTTDGSTPSQTAGIVYGGPFTISESTLLQAVAISAAGAVSPVTSANYTIVPLPTTAAPSFSPAGGTYVGSQVVTISTTTSGATIRYTTDGSTPSELSGAIYMGPLNLSGSVTLTAIAFAPDCLDSPVASATYTIVPLPSAAAPSFSPAGGTYAGSQVVTITSTTSGAAIRYTTDGSTPSETNGTLYAGTPVNISDTTTLKAIAYATGLADSPVSSGLYVINSSPVASLNVVHDFAAFNNGGAHPSAGLTQSSDGVFRGTTGGGGSGYYGTVFQMTPAGAFTTLFSFDVTNGTGSSAGLIQGSDGNFYGTTGSGGSGSYGTVFRMTPAGALTTLVSFDGDNGVSPFAGLIQGSDGDFYGTTQYGGGGSWGTVFRMTPAGVLTTLASFNGDNGDDLLAGLVQGSDGNFYGTTVGGGSSSNGDGTVFMMTPAGVLTTLVSFDRDNGANPWAALVQGRDGNFYGTTSNGGSSGNGTVFMMTPAGVLTTLVSFNFADGNYPVAGLVLGSDGSFYGTTVWGGAANDGTVFRMTPAGVLTTLVSFNGANGANPYGGLVQGSDGNFYGTTLNGGASDEGVIFRLIVPPQAAAPVFSPAAGTYESVQTVKITSTTSGATIRYTTDGSTPTRTYGSIYSGPLSIGETLSIKAIAYADGFIASPVVEADYTVVPLANPAIVPVGGTYHGTQFVTIVSAEPAVTIRYTRDGSTPTSTHGTIYCGPIRISATTTLKAVAYKTGFHNSGVATAEFVILPPQTLNLEAEALTYVLNGATARILNDRNASNKKWIELAADGIGDSITFTLHAVPAELYQLKLLWKSDDDRGILRLKVDGNPVGSALDQYSASPSFRATVFGLVYLTEGDHVIQLVVTGRRPGSHGFTASADKFTLAGQ